MARRKQRNPQANLGPPEARTDAVVPSDEDEGGLALQEWEEANAYTARPRKRAKAQTSPPDVIALADGPQEWHFANVALEVVPNADTLGGLRRVRLAPADGRPGLSLSVPGGSSLATLPTSTTQVAEALQQLVQQGYLQLGPIVPTNDKDQPSTSTANGVAGAAAALSLGAKALVDTATWEEDQQQRKWQTHLLHVLRWALPHAGLDPEAGPAPQEFSGGGGSPRNRAPVSPPGSPRSPRSGQAAAAQASFDAAELYAAVKPTGAEPELQGELLELKPTLRRYQRRAACWMLGKERGSAAAEGAAESLHVLWREVPCGSVGVRSRKGGSRAARCFYINPWTGRLSLERFPSSVPPKGAILSDQMGLGKTVELLALMCANKYQGPAPAFPAAGTAAEGRTRRERIDCVCGADDATPFVESYDGLWLQCDACLAWQHGACTGYPRRAPPGEYTCGACRRAAAAAEVTQPCGTTLIVCPAPILAQWHSELQRHIQPGALKVLVYHGQLQPQAGAASAPTAAPAATAAGGGGGGVVTAAELASVDVVLTTYDVLRRDLDRQPDGEAAGRALRGRKRYEVVPTPLTRLRFWRVCLDEAQMVESSTARAAAMALRIQTVHRWAVTGTPLSRGLEDLQGLLAFLQAAPFSSRFWWLRCVQAPCEAGSGPARARLLKLLRPAQGGLLWRSSKADVADELALPPQRQVLARLEFSAIERHFYARQHQECLGAARAALSASVLAAALSAGELGAAGGGAQPASFADRPLTQREERKLLHPLLRLRQACVHPQVGAGGIRKLEAARAPMTMGEVLEVLLGKARVEAEDAQRVLLASLNGLAGLLRLQGLHADAARAYREGLRTAEANAELVRADKLQQLHALHNLAEMLEGGAAGVPRTLRDGELRGQADALRDEYCAEPAARVAAAEGELQEAEAAEERPREELRRAAGAATDGLLEGWWVDAAHLLSRHSDDGGDYAAAHIKHQLGEADTYRYASSRNASSLALRFRDLSGLQVLLSRELGDMRKAKGEALAGLRSLGELVASPSEALVEAAANCGRCVPWAGRARGVCRHCQLDEQFIGWEVRLFSLVASAREAGAQVSAEQAAREALAATLRRVGRGGLGEGAGPSGATTSATAVTSASAAAGRNDEAVARSVIVRHPSEAERALGLLLQQLRQLKVPAAVGEQRELVVAAARAHLEQLEAARRVYLKARAVALQQRHKLYALDELAMCTMRMRVCPAGQWIAPGDEIFTVHEQEVPVRSTELSADKAVAAAELARTLGTLRYLQGLKARAQTAASSPQKPCATAAAEAAAAPSNSNAARDQAAVPAEDAAVDACPVCHEALGRELVMLPCGHALCYRCNVALVERAPVAGPPGSRRIACPTCRLRVPLDDIAFVDAGKDAAAQLQQDLTLEDGPSEVDAGGAGPSDAASWAAAERRVRVRGSYGSKLEAVVRRLVGITASDPGARVLFFSSWKDVLELTSHALTANALPHLYPRTPRRFEAAVAEFRAGGGDPAAPRVLLLLVKQGANGLNLQEAQHVVFAEPLLDPAEEAQARGRVHRFGQRHETFVHHFVVERSVEHNVQRLAERRAVAMDLEAVAVKRKKGGGEKGALTVADVAVLLREGGGEERGGQE